MRDLKKYLAATVLCLMCISVQAQMAIGGWQTHFSYLGIKQATQTNNKVYALSNGNLFSVEKEDGSIETYSKITGLSDGNIDFTSYNEERDILVICYSNQNIDIIEKGRIYNLPDIARKEISNRTINNVTFHDKYMYLSCGFGIVVINLQKKEVVSTYIIGKYGSYTNVEQVQVSSDSIYALTANYLFTASLADPNLSNYAHWESHDLPITADWEHEMVWYDGVLNLFYGEWYQWKNGWETVDMSDFKNVTYAHIYKDKLTVYSPFNKHIGIIGKGYQIDTMISNIANDAIYDPTRNEIWVTGDSLKRYDKGNFALKDVYCPDGPKINNVSFFKYDKENLISGFGTDYTDKGIVQWYDGKEWRVITEDNIGIENKDAYKNFKTIWDATLDPKDSKRMYVSTWRSIYEFYDGQFEKKYTAEETSLDKWAGDPSIIQVVGIRFDKEGNMWVLNTQAGNLVNLKDTDGNWYSLNYSELFDKATVSDFLIASNGYKYITFPRLGSGLFVLNDNKTPSKTSDDKHKLISTFTLSDGNKVTPSRVFCVAEDKKGEIWIGTDVGPIILRSTNNIFNDNYRAARIKITRQDDNSLADYLLAAEQINGICVDGANRKWIATSSSGAYLLSPDGQETIHHFTTDNSPLTTNSITKIALDPKTGLVFISTPNGMFAYQSDAADGEKTLSDIHVYPNPVAPDYSGPITVSGLMEDTEVRITDAMGRIVCHGLSYGSMFTWDGYLANGQRASTGVYFVFGTTKDGNESNVAKFAIIKR